MSLSSRSFEFQPLESRQLLSGVTLLIHGHEGNITGWITSAADAITAKVGAAGVSQYVMKLGLDSKKHVAVQSMTLTKGPTLANSTAGEIVVKVDWTSIDDGSQSTKTVGKAISDYMLASHTGLPALASLPIHIIGHSRGGSMVVAVSKNLGAAGVQVDQDTFLDPHPVGSYFGFGYDDEDMAVYSNVVFADNYWRDNGQGDFAVDPNGQHVDGAHEGNLNNTVQKNYIVSAHMSVTAYYHGTIDTKAIANNDEPILASKWYGTTADKPARTVTGYYFSRIDGGTRPADGLEAAYGGTATRKDIDASGAQWANINNLRIAGGAIFSVGQKISVHYSQQDRDSGDTVQLYFDNDNNPFNSNVVQKAAQVNIGEADDVANGAISAKTDGMAPGAYYILAKITDATGHARFAYTRKIILNAPAARKAQSYSPPPVPAAPATPSYTTVASSIFSDTTV